MMSLSDDKQADIIDTFNTTSRYLDDILKINNVYFDNMAIQIYPSELQLNKAGTSDTEATFLDLLLSFSTDTGIEPAIDPPPPRKNFVHYDFLKLHYIRHKIKDVSPLRVAALSVTLRYIRYPQNSIKRPW